MFIYSFCFSRTCRFHNYNHQQPKLGFPSLWAEAAPIQKYFGPQATFNNSYFLHASIGEAHCHRGSFYRQRRRSSAKIWLRRRRCTVVWNNQDSVLLSAVIGGRRSSSSLVRSSALEEIEGQGHLYLLAIEGTIVHWRSYRSIPRVNGSLFIIIAFLLLIKLTRSHRWPCP